MLSQVMKQPTLDFENQLVDEGVPADDIKKMQKLSNPDDKVQAQKYLLAQRVLQNTLSMPIENVGALMCAIRALDVVCKHYPTDASVGVAEDYRERINAQLGQAINQNVRKRVFGG